MNWIIVWLVVWIIYIIVSFLKYINSPTFDFENFLITLSGFIGITSTLFLVLYQNSLTFYFYWTRFKNWFRNYSATWQSNIRFDGHFDYDVINKIKIYVESQTKLKHKAKILHKTNSSINFLINDTLNFYVEYESQKTTQLGYDTLDIKLSAFNIGSNDSREKLNKELIPIFEELYKIIRPENASYVLNIKFKKTNPFYTVFVSHLKTSHIKTFTVDLLLDQYSNCSSKDIVTVNKENIVINANTIHALKELTNDFIYLSTNLKKYLRGKKNG